MCMFFASLTGDRTAYETGHRAVTRAALNGAAQAVFVLAPPNRTVRTRHALRLAADDLGSYERAVEGLHSTGWSTALELNTDPAQQANMREGMVARRVALAATADQVGLSRTKLGKEPQLGEMLDYAVAQLPDQRTDDLRGALRMTLAQLNSAMHSGRWHGLLTGPHTMDTPDGPRARLVTTTLDLMLMATGPIVLVQRALDLFALRGRPL